MEELKAQLEEAKAQVRPYQAEWGPTSPPFVFLNTAESGRRFVGCLITFSCAATCAGGEGDEAC
jgi:hypothetical protein